MQTPNTTTLPLTNINNSALAKYLSEQRENATFSAVIYTKVGKTRGGVQCGTDTVLDTIVTGFSYENLVAKDLKSLDPTLTATDDERPMIITPEMLQKAIAESKQRDRNGHVPSIEQCAQAIAEQAESFRKTLAGTNRSTTDHVREPVIVNGERIPGCWVNNGMVDRAKTGVPYIYGLRVGRKVLEKGEHPIPPTKSGPVPLAKRILRNKFLRVGKFMSVKLQGDFILKLGGEAAVMADDRGVEVHEEVPVREVYERAA